MRIGFLSLKMQSEKTENSTSQEVDNGQKPKRHWTPNPDGRKSRYNPEFIPIIKQWIEAGATFKAIANDLLEITEKTLYQWKHTYPEFREALEVSREIADKQVECALYKRATGFTEIVKRNVIINGEIVEVEQEEYFPPSDKSIAFWLKNRKSSEWRETIDHEITGKDGNPIESLIKIEFVKTSEDESSAS